MYGHVLGPNESILIGRLYTRDMILDPEPLGVAHEVQPFPHLVKICIKHHFIYKLQQ